MDKETLDRQVRDIVQRRLLSIPDELRNYVPRILLKSDVDCFTYLTDIYFILALVDRKEKKRIKKLIAKRLDPFPGLIRPEGISSSKSVFLRVTKTKNGLLDHNSVKNAFSLSLGKDSTLIIWDHKQSFDIAGYGNLEYVVELAYVISFGNEINIFNLLDFLEDSIAYSLKQWKEENAK